MADYKFFIEQGIFSVRRSKCRWCKVRLHCRRRCSSLSVDSQLHCWKDFILMFKGLWPRRSILRNEVASGLTLASAKDFVCDIRFMHFIQPEEELTKTHASVTKYSRPAWRGTNTFGSGGMHYSSQDVIVMKTQTAEGCTAMIVVSFGAFH